jgi:hypothetical protein
MGRRLRDFIIRINLDEERRKILDDSKEKNDISNKATSHA